MPYKSESRLAYLSDLMRQHTISRVELAELEELLLKDDKHMEEYIRLTAMDSMLHASFSNEGADNLDHLFPQPSFELRRRSSKHDRWFWGGIAAAFVLAATGVVGLKYAIDQNNATTGTASDNNKPSPPFADHQRPVISGSLGLGASQQKALQQFTRLTHDPVTLTSGLLKIDTHTGGQLIVQAPARFQFTAPDRMQLDYGKVHVETRGNTRPPIISYGAGRLAKGSEAFAISISKDTHRTAELTSIFGSLEIRSPDMERTTMLAQRESLRHLPGGITRTIPFQGDLFHTHIPSRDFVWTCAYQRDDNINWFSPGDPTYEVFLSPTSSETDPKKLKGYGLAEAKTLTFDVSDLVWQPGQYRAALRWLNGVDALVIEQVQLYHQGTLVSEDRHLGKTGLHNNTFNNLYHFSIPSENFHTGGWELRATVRGAIREDGELPELSEGMLHFVGEADFLANQDSFIGDWKYRYDGQNYMRRISPDGHIRLYINGEEFEANSGRWWVKNHILHAEYESKGKMIERLMLQTPHSLIFLDRPYNNAKKVR